MTADKFHDALTLLPADLIAEADRKRSRKVKPISLRRYAALAACAAFLLCAGLVYQYGLLPGVGSRAKETAAIELAAEAASPEEGIAEDAFETVYAAEESLAGSSQSAAEDTTAATGGEVLPCARFETPPEPLSSACFSAPRPFVLTSRAELEAYLTEHASRYDLSRMAAGIADYDDAWFENHDLLIAVVYAAAGAAPEITAIEATPEDPMGWDWSVLISGQGDGEAATVFHLLTGVEKGMIGAEDRILRVMDVPEGD